MRKNGQQPSNGNRFLGVTERETQQKMREFDRHLETLSDSEMEQELAKLSLPELHALAWATTYRNRRKGGGRWYSTRSGSDAGHHRHQFATARRTAPLD